MVRCGQRLAQTGRSTRSRVPASAGRSGSTHRPRPSPCPRSAPRPRLPRAWSRACSCSRNCRSRSFSCSRSSCSRSLSRSLSRSRACSSRSFRSPLACRCGSTAAGTRMMGVGVRSDALAPEDAGADRAGAPVLIRGGVSGSTAAVAGAGDLAAAAVAVGSTITDAATAATGVAVGVLDCAVAAGSNRPTWLPKYSRTRASTPRPAARQPQAGTCLRGRAGWAGGSTGGVRFWDGRDDG